MKLTQQQLEAHLWGAANILRGRTAGQDYKNYILSLMFYKRLCDQWMCDADETIEELERQQGQKFTDKQKDVLRARGDHRFTIPDGCHWNDLLEVSENIGEVLTAAMRGGTKPDGNPLRGIGPANEDLRGVFTVDWNQPAPDGGGKKLIPNEVVHALVQHFDMYDLSNKSVPPDILGRAYEYLIKQFADDAGAKAGEFFTPPEVVDVLVRILEPGPRDKIYDPTCGSGGMLIHSADYLTEQGHRTDAAQYFGQEMLWNNFAIAKINSVLHGIDAHLHGGDSTITDPYFTNNEGKVQKFSMVLANFPFSDEFWWLKPEQQGVDKKRKQSLRNQVFLGGYKDTYGRFGRGTPYATPPASKGDFAFILHIVASLTRNGRAGVVCPQGVLFRGQPKIEEETCEFDKNGNPKIRKRKADDEYLIRHSMLKSRLIDAVIALPLNIFYGAGVPACLLILRKDRPENHREKVLLVYAARHFRDSAQNQLRPQDIMRILVHYHAYGDSAKAKELVVHHSERIHGLIDTTEQEEVNRLTAQYQAYADRLTELKVLISESEAVLASLTNKQEQKKHNSIIKKLQKQTEKPTVKLVERDDKIDEACHRSKQDRTALEKVGEELIELYSNTDELVKHARVVEMDELEENEFDLNIPRYVDTFEPEPEIKVSEAMAELKSAEIACQEVDAILESLLKEIGYDV